MTDVEHEEGGSRDGISVPSRQQDTECLALTRLHETSSRLASNQDLPTLLQDLVDESIAISGAHKGYIQLVDEASATLRVVAGRGFQQDFLDGLATKQQSSDTWAATLRRNERIVIEDIERVPLNDAPWIQALREAGVRALQITPMIARDGEMLGLCATHWTQPHSLAMPTPLILDLLARQASDLIEHRQREQALHELDRRKNEFLSMLGHELRNPLTPISLILGSIQRRRKDPFKQEHETIERQIRHMVRLVDDLLDITRISRGTLQIKKRPMSLNNAVATALQVVTPMIEKRRHKIDVRIPRIYLVGDEERLAQVFTNLLINAASYTPPGGHLSMSATRQHGEISITVQDNGVGMPTHFLPKAFQLYSQAAAPADGMVRGLGLGLAIVKHIVSLHEGSVEVASEGPGKGSTLTVRLPALEGQTARRASITPSPQTSAKLSQRILVVDDNEDVLVWLPTLLEKLGHSATTARDGPQALEIAKAVIPDIVILDLGMPEMDGYETAKQLQQALEERSPQLIALSGFGQDADRERCLEAGFIAHITKPNLDGLVDAIETCIARSRVAAAVDGETHEL